MANLLADATILSYGVAVEPTEGSDELSIMLDGAGEYDIDHLRYTVAFMGTSGSSFSEICIKMFLCRHSSP